MNQQILDLVRTAIPDYLEIDGEPLGLDDVVADNATCERVIRYLDTQLEPFTDKDFPPEVTVKFIMWHYLRARAGDKLSMSALQIIVEKSDPQIFKVVN